LSTTTSGWRAFCERCGGGGAASGCSTWRGLLGEIRRRGGGGGSSESGMSSGATAGMSGSKLLKRLRSLVIPPD
jgi:hypothetical protein